MVIPHALSFPHAFSADGLLGGGAQTTAWLYIFWHLGFPLFVLFYALLARSKYDAMRANSNGAIAAACVMVALLVVSFTLLATAGHDLLPVVIRGDSYSVRNTNGITPVLWLVTAVVLLIVWYFYFAAPTVLELWLMVVLVAWLIDVSFSALLDAHRYDFGWYAGRAYGLMAASFVLGVLVIEMNRLYGNLIGALNLAGTRNAELIHSREELARVQRYEAIGQVVGGVAHDFNNVLTVITGALDRLSRDETIADKHQRPLNASVKAVERGQQMTQQLLTFASRKVLRPETVNLNEVITDLDAFLVRSAGEGIALTTKLDPMLWATRVDRTQFETALVNLVVNARDALDGEGEIVIATRNTMLDADAFPGISGGHYLFVSVTDSGCGMPPEVVARAFDPFFTTKEVGKGSGLGLSQVYGFAASASGHVRISSKPRVGTAIEIYLPSSGEPAPRRAGPRVRSSLRRAARHQRVLVVEDDPDVLDVAVNAFVELGFRVRAATNAREALEILRGDEGIAVLFSDVVMPGTMNGAQLAAEARRTRPNLKVLLTSGYAASALAKEHGLPETIYVLPKPYRQSELAEKLHLVMEEPVDCAFSG